MDIMTLLLVGVLALGGYFAYVYIRGQNDPAYTNKLQGDFLNKLGVSHYSRMNYY